MTELLSSYLKKKIMKKDKLNMNERREIRLLALLQILIGHYYL